jgi:predicted aspartyl protease
MPSVDCGFQTQQGGPTGSDLLAIFGPTLIVDIGFDPNYNAQLPGYIPFSGVKGIRALVDTGATECCIDSLLAATLNLPIIDKRMVAGAHGSQEINMHLAQVHVPGINLTMHGAFAGVHLAAGGQPHQALIGRTFLRHCKMVYDGVAGAVTIST